MVAPIGGIWAPVALRLARTAAYKASRAIHARLVNATRPATTALEPALVRASPRQPIHPAALLRQQKSRRWHSTSATYHNINAAVRRFISTRTLQGGSRIDRSRFLRTQTGRAVAQFSGQAPFASTLRPNLTGGALPRTAGGYGLGSGRIGGARYFSHTGAAQAQVVQNVSSAVRAFWISGQKAQFDGLTPRGEMRFRAVPASQDEAVRKMASLPRSAPGSYIDFHLSPTVTALSPLAAAFPYPTSGAKGPVVDATSLNTEGFLDVLSGDFARALKDMTRTLADIRKLSSLGDLPIQLENGHTLRVRFPGVDAETIESLCNDLGLTRGLVNEDSEFSHSAGVPIALKFPFAPEAGSVDSRTVASSGRSARTSDSFPREEELFEGFSEMNENPWLTTSEVEGYETLSPPFSSGEHCSEDFEGLEGIYRFIEECDRAKDRF
jgi:hypothetical protein